MNVNYPSLLKEIDFYLVPKRKESASFLMWYLEKYYRLDVMDAIDSVCDNSGDKGVDGIYINDSLGTIDIFQSKISQTTTKTVGDSVLKEFYGTLGQFENREKVENLVNSAGKAEVASLINRLNLLDKIGSYPVRGIFISNIELSDDGAKYLSKVDTIEYIGKEILEKEYISDLKEIKKQEKAEFDISGTDITTYYVDSETKTYIAPVKATELVKMEGIEDQSIFHYNVRGALGNTKINKGIIKSIKNRELHKKFPLFHNGITIVAEEVEKSDEKIILKNFYVVNGCQSLTSLYRFQNFLTEDLNILTKVIKVPINSPLSGQITDYSNRQNGVKARDFKSYNQIQVRLQNEMKEKYGENFFYEIKRDDLKFQKGETISNELIGIYLMSFDLKEPWNTHRKYQVFEDAYSRLFARPEVTADRIVFLHLLNKVVQEKVKDLKNQMIARYSLIRYIIIYIVRNFLEQDDKGLELIKNPNSYVRDEESRSQLEEVLGLLIDDIIIDINGEVAELDEDFDYKSKLRDDNWVKNLNKNIVTNYLKQVNRGRIEPFSHEWEKRAVIV